MLAGAVGILALASTLVVLARGSATPSPTAAGDVPRTATRPDVVAAPGRVEPVSEEIVVGVEISGRLREVLVEEGDRVTKGQLIARIENGDFVARLASAEARAAGARADLDRLVNGARAEERREAAAIVAQADASRAQSNRDVERMRTLFKSGAVSRDELEQAERNELVARAKEDEVRERFNTVNADARVDERRRAEAAVRLADSQVAEARALVAKTEIRSPIDGTVLKKHHKAGESLSTDSPDAVIVTLGDLRVLRVRVDVDETDVADVALGQPAWVTADAYGTRRFAGHVVRVGESLGRQRTRTDRPSERNDTRILETLVELDPGSGLPVGLRVDAFIARRAAR
jgi:HlyD family secretion protein